MAQTENGEEGDEDIVEQRCGADGKEQQRRLGDEGEKTPALLLAELTAIDLDDLSARWGQITFRAAGDLAVDASGVPTGRITVKAVEWRKLLEMAVGTGLVAETFRPALERALGLMASLEGNPDTLDAPLTFEKGFIALGPIPLGPAPRIVIR